MTSATTINQNPDSAAAATGAFSQDAFDLLVSLSQQSAVTVQPHKFALEAVKAAAISLRTSHFGIAEKTGDGQRLSVIVRNNLQQHVANDDHHYELDFACDQSLFIESMRSERVLLVDDLTSTPWNDPAFGECSLVSAMAVPLAGPQHTLGALAVFDHAARKFSKQDSALLDAVANLATSALCRCHAEQELSTHRSLVQSLNETMESMMLVLRPDGRITSVNQSCCSVTGFAERDLQSRSIWSALLLPEDMSEVKRAFARIQNGQPNERFDSYLLTKQGERRRVSWSITRLDADEGVSASIVLTGIDITDRCEAIERAVRAEAVADNAKRTLHELKQQLSSGEQTLVDGQAANRLPNGVEHDRRARPRRDYPYLQLIAPMHDSEIPPEGAFRELQCRDISSRGFSFFTSSPLNCEKVVVAFGTPPAVVYLIAEIRHKTEKQIDGRRQFVVGCRYTGRVTK